MLNFKEFLYEMAFSKRKVEEKVTGIAPQIMKHVIKVVRYNDPNNLNKHIRDIDAWYESIVETPKSKPAPTEADYFKWLYSELVYDLIRVVRRLDRDYDTLKVIEHDAEVIRFKFAAVSRYAAKAIYNRTGTSRDEILQILLK